MRWLFGLLIAVALPVTASAAECRRVAFEGARFTACRIDLTTEALRLWLYDTEGRPYGSFARLNQALEAKGQALGIAMNAGMYHDDRAPVGLYIEDGQTLAPIVTRDGPGNFGLLPNGVLCIAEGGARVIESRAFKAEAPDCRFATQSGPMLLQDNALHPRFLRDSDSRYIRNGVGVRAGGREVIVAISESPVNFHRFARFFRDMLRTPDALFLDGSISKLYAPGLGRADVGRPMGPILGTVVPGG